jgi:hypothetical protein
MQLIANFFPPWVNWIAFLPPLLSIYLLLISGFAKAFIVKDIERFSANDPNLKAKQDVIKNVVLSWATQIGFFNAMFASMFSVFSIYSKTRSFGWLVLTLVVLFTIFIPMFWWIRHFEPDGLEAITVWKWGGGRTQHGSARFGCSL